MKKSQEIALQALATENRGTSETGALFPRVHINETKASGIRGPPRNKMALFEQFTIPPHRFKPPHPELSTQSLPNEMPLHTIQSISKERRSKRKPCHLKPTVSSVSMQHQTGDHSSRKQNITTPIVRHVYARQALEKLAGFSHSSMERFTFYEGGKQQSPTQSSGGENENVRELRSLRPVSNGGLAYESLSLGASELVGRDTREGRISSNLMHPSQAETASKVDKNYDSLEKGPRVSVRQHKGLSLKSTNDTNSGTQASHGVEKPAKIIEGLNPLVKSSVCQIKIIPRDVIGVIGQQEFWMARKTIVQQQKILSRQVFELHRLIKVQQLIATMPGLLGEDMGCTLLEENHGRKIVGEPHHPHASTQSDEVVLVEAKTEKPMKSSRGLKSDETPGLGSSKDIMTTWGYPYLPSAKQWLNHMGLKSYSLTDVTTKSESAPMHMQHALSCMLPSYETWCKNTCYPFPLGLCSSLNFPMNTAQVGPSSSEGNTSINNAQCMASSRSNGQSMQVSLQGSSQGVNVRDDKANIGKTKGAQEVGLPTSGKSKPSSAGPQDPKKMGPPEKASPTKFTNSQSLVSLRARNCAENASESTCITANNAVMTEGEESAWQVGGILPLFPLAPTSKEATRSSLLESQHTTKVIRAVPRPAKAALQSTAVILKSLQQEREY